MRSFWSIFLDQFDEIYILVLLGFAVAMLVISIFSAESKQWLEAFTIFFAVVFAGMIQTLCDWGKEKQFLRLQQEIMNEKIQVLRGQYGTSQTIYVKDLVVGDVILLNQGDRVPADCLLLQEMDMVVDQKQLFSEEIGSEAVTKQCSYLDREGDIKYNPDPILVQDSLVMQGTGKAVVLAVGKHTLKEQELAADLKADKYALQIEKSETPFQEKLRILAEIIGAYANMCFWLSVVLFTAVWLLFVLFSDVNLVSDESFIRLIELGSTAVALVIVCIPEGMPLVISMAMAFSVDQLKEEKLLIKNLDALETSGQVIDILTGKTATLTTGDMEVARLEVNNRVVTSKDIQVNIQTMQRLNQAIILNNDAHMQMRGEIYRPQGSPVDVGLLNFLNAQDIAVQDKLVERERDYELKLWIPFSSERKIMTTAYRLKDQPGTVRVFVKGAPEVVVEKCSGKVDDYNQAGHFDGQGHQGREYLDNVIEKQIIVGPNPAVHAADRNGDDDAYESQSEPTGLKALTLAYRDFDENQFDGLLQTYNKFENEADRLQIESDLIMIGSVGLSDPIRENIDEAIAKLQEGSTNVRIFSGDSRAALMSIATQAGILSDVNDNQYVQNGADVLQQLRPLMMESEDQDEGRGKSFVFRNSECKKAFRNNIKKTVLLVYRATPELKHMFVAALRNSNSTVAVTGEGLSDARALSEASVGFTMGEDGCSAAKDHADIILTDDNFFTVVTAIRWGRNVQDNVRKFVQFQMTVNLSCMFFVLTQTVILGHPPLNILQLLWINLIMDVLAAIAFATENPHPTEIRKERVSAKDKILTPTMMRSILSQGIYQILVMLLLMYTAPQAGDYPYNLFNTPMTDSATGQLSPRALHQTFMFHCFVMMNLFNMINCRVLDTVPKEVSIEDSSLDEQAAVEEANKPNYNIFTRPFNNWWFWIVFLVELNIQFLMIGYADLGKLFSTIPLTTGMHLTAVFLGLGSWILAAVMKASGKKLLAIMPEFGEDEEALAKAKNRGRAVQGAMTFEPGSNQAAATDKGEVLDTEQD